MKTLTSEKGFTLVELMMSISIATVLMLATFFAMDAGSRQLDTIGVKMTLQESAREGLFKMVQELRLSASDRVVITGGGNTITFDVPDVNAPINTNTLDAVQDYSVDWATSESVQYSVVGTQIIRTDMVSLLETVVANDVTSVSFVGDAAQPSIVTITINAQRTLLNGQVIPAAPMQIIGQAEIRNS